MLSLREIVKTYHAGDTDVHALQGVSIDFRESEFVSILGPSGCGKTTLLNVIGGLDRYDGGDLVINGRSTKEYNDADWDTYIATLQKMGMDRAIEIKQATVAAYDAAAGK